MHAIIHWSGWLYIGILVITVTFAKAWESFWARWNQYAIDLLEQAKETNYLLAGIQRQITALHSSIKDRDGKE